MRRKLTTFVAALVIALAAHSAFAAKLSPSLSTKLPGLADSAPVGVVIVSFNNTGAITDAQLGVLRSLGIAGGKTFPHLGMVAVNATAGQVRALAASPSVRSVWSNDRLFYYDYQARTLTGVDRTKQDTGFMKLNGGLPVSGKGDFSVLIIDSGIDATHDDLKLGQTVIQNVQVLMGSDTVTNDGFTPVVALENVPNTDQSVGHGTHCAGIVAGTGQRSGGKYAGVAPGAHLIGAGLGAGVFVLNALGAWEWGLANQYAYNIRVVSNSYGSFAAFDPNDPINVASKAAHDGGIVVVFAGANSGPGKNTFNRYAKAPWVISVAAGTKEGGLASFSSRGTPAEQRLNDDDPLNDFDAPTITAPGTGREFASDSSKFTAAIISTRSTSNLVANGQTDDTEIEPTMIPFYTQISGTSMATPYVAGVVALMLDADPTLTPDEIKQLIVETATRMPGYQDFEVGAGYINAYAAVDKVFHRERQYNTFNNVRFNAQFTVSGPAPVSFHIDYDPTGTPGEGSVNSKSFDVPAGMNVLDVIAAIDNVAQTGDGNVIGMVVYAPDGTAYSSGIALPVLDAPSREVVVRDPAAGHWRVEIRGARGLTAVPGVSLPTSGAGLPGPVDGTITLQRFDLAPVADIQNDALRTDIETALKNRRIDTLADGLFHPDQAATREDFARALLLNTPVRQSLGSAPKFADVSGDLSALADALTANGSTLRDWNFAPAGLMSATATGFSPATTITRLDLAVAFVRALGLDTEAKAKAGTAVTYNGSALTDNAQIPAALRGYVQYAIDKGFLEVYPAEVKQIAPGQFQALPGPRVEPSNAVTRAALAAKLNAFAAKFAAGN
jgi:serine protease AprX